MNDSSSASVEWRRGGDSNPGTALTRSHAFQACSFNRSDTSPISGGAGTRTLGTPKGTPVFETGPFDHSGTPPIARFRERREFYVSRDASSTAITRRLASSRSKKVLENGGATVTHDLGMHLQAVIQTRITHNIHQCAAGTCPWVGRPINHTGKP